MRSGELAANQSSQGHHRTRMEFDVEKMEGSVGMLSIWDDIRKGGGGAEPVPLGNTSPHLHRK